MTPDPTLQAFLEAQSAAYRAGLPERLQTLERLWEEVGDAPDAPLLRTLERCAHGLAGSAATFGLPALGDAARALEQALETAAPGAPLDPELVRHYEALRARLREEIGPP